MALDTWNRRASALLVGLGFGRVFPVPDGSLATEGDRLHMALSFAAGVDSIVATAPYSGTLTVSARAHTLTIGDV